MSLGSSAIIDAATSHALATGMFERVNKHEPKDAPGAGLTAALWVDRIRPIPARSGLASTTALLVLILRIYSNMLQEPQDAIDPVVTDAVDALMTAYSGDLDLGGLISNIDLLGAHGQAMEARAGYLNVSGTMYRVMDLTIPCVVNDAWTQVL